MRIIHAAAGQEFNDMTAQSAALDPKGYTFPRSRRALHAPGERLRSERQVRNGEAVRR